MSVESHPSPRPEHWPSGPEAWELLFREALALDLPYEMRPGVEEIVQERLRVLERRGRRAAVLMLVGFRGDSPSPELLLIKRSARGYHAGQMAFPGGGVDPADGDPEGEGVERAARREAREEVGLPEEGTVLLGRLPPLFTLTSDYWVIPVVAIWKGDLAALDPLLVPNPEEVDHVVWMGVQALADPSVYSLDTVESGGRSYSTHAYRVGGERVWGATSAMIHNLLSRLLAVSRL
ncbi:MAG: CoA pyrophosphatase [Bdellovibrionales bacterium]|nr:CoA pyrophosphatase [Bdellovibrionales bacterium]